MSRPAAQPNTAHAGTLRLSVVEGMLHAVMLGASESYLGTLAVELGHRDQALALLATVPLLAGALAQLSCGTLSRVLGGRGRLVVGGAALQALSVLGLYAVAITGNRGLWPFLLIKTLFWVTGSVIAPPWGAWMSELTDEQTRTRYFAIRSAWVSGALVVSFAGSGLWLHHGGGALPVYGELFLCAFLARAFSAVCLAFHREPERPSVHVSERPGTLRRVLKRARWRTALYMAGLMFAAHTSVPFFTPYMLRTLTLDYEQFTVLMSASVLVKTLAFPACHPIAARIGMRKLLTLAGLGISFTPALWCVAGVDQLVYVELFSGTAWAAWEYATFQLLLTSSARTHQLTFLAMAGSIAAVGQLAGALFGTLLIERVGLSYREVFAVSSALRITSLAVLLIDPATLPKGLIPRRVAVRLTSIRPNAGAIARMIVNDSEDDNAPSAK